MPDYINYFQDNVDRTSIVFLLAALLFTGGIWAYIFGATTLLEGKFQYDAVSLLPCLLAISSFFALNLLMDRTVILDNNVDFFGNSNRKAKRYLAFVLFALSMLAVAFGLLMATLRYAPRGWDGMAWGLSTLTLAITMSSFLIFFGRSTDTF